MFRIGQKVVVINDKPGYKTNRKPNFINGEIVEITILEPRKECIAVGVNNQFWTWHPSRFKPIVEKKTDISIFTQMLMGDKELV